MSVLWNTNYAAKNFATKKRTIPAWPILQGVRGRERGRRGGGSSPFCRPLPSQQFSPPVYSQPEVLINLDSFILQQHLDIIIHVIRCPEAFEYLSTQKLPQIGQNPANTPDLVIEKRHKKEFFLFHQTGG